MLLLSTIFQLAYKDMQGLSMYNLCIVHVKFIYVELTMEAITLKGNSVSPQLLVSMKMIQFYDLI
jgi:hypothetical protein